MGVGASCGPGCGGYIPNSGITGIPGVGKAGGRPGITGGSTIGLGPSGNGGMTAGGTIA